MSTGIRLPLTSVTIALISFSAAAGATEGVSPGELDRIVQAPSACPTFSWEASPGAALYDIAAYAIADDDSLAALGPAVTAEQLYTEVLSQEVSGKATSWTPSAEKCFASGGRYAWFVRAVSEIGEANEWSRGRYFATPVGPTPEEVRRALAVLEAWSQGAGAVAGVSPAPGEAAADRLPRVTPLPLVPGAIGLRAVPTAVAAIRGEQPDFSGEAYGVVGVSSSVDGAGVAAANLEGGPDLVLDGSADGGAGTELSEWGINRPADTDQTFYFRNLGTGRLEVSVVGDISGHTADLEELKINGATVIDDVGDWHGSGDTIPCTDCVTTSDLAAGAVTATDLATGAVDTVNLRDKAVTGAKIALHAVTTTHIGDGAIDYRDLATGAVRTAAILDGTIASADLADDAVTNAKLATDSVTGKEIASGAVRTAEILDGQVMTADLADGAVTSAKIAAGSVTMTDLAADSVGSSQIEHAGVGTDDIDFGAVGTGQLADGAVTSAKIANDAVDTQHLAAGSVDALAIANLTIQGLDIADNAISSSKINDLSVISADLGVGSVTSPKILDGTVGTIDIADSAVSTAKLAVGAVTTAKIADGAVTNAKLAVDSVTNSKIGDSAVTSSNIGANAVTSPAIAPGAVTSSGVADGALTAADMNPAGGVYASKSAVYEVESTDTIVADECKYLTASCADLNDLFIAGGFDAPDAFYLIRVVEALPDHLDDPTEAAEFKARFCNEPGSGLVGVSVRVFCVSVPGP